MDLKKVCEKADELFAVVSETFGEKPEATAEDTQYDVRDAVAQNQPNAVEGSGFDPAWAVRGEASQARYRRQTALDFATRGAWADHEAACVVRRAKAFIAFIEGE